MSSQCGSMNHYCVHGKHPEVGVGLAPREQEFLSDKVNALIKSYEMNQESPTGEKERGRTRKKRGCFTKKLPVRPTGKAKVLLHKPRGFSANSKAQPYTVAAQNTAHAPTRQIMKTKKAGGDHGANSYAIDTPPNESKIASPTYSDISNNRTECCCPSNMCCRFAKQPCCVQTNVDGNCAFQPCIRRKKTVNFQMKPICFEIPSRGVPFTCREKPTTPGKPIIYCKPGSMFSEPKPKPKPKSRQREIPVCKQSCCCFCIKPQVQCPKPCLKSKPQNTCGAKTTKSRSETLQFPPSRKCPNPCRALSPTQYISSAPAQSHRKEKCVPKTMCVCGKSKQWAESAQPCSWLIPQNRPKQQTGRSFNTTLCSGSCNCRSKPVECCQPVCFKCCGCKSQKNPCERYKPPQSPPSCMCIDCCCVPTTAPKCPMPEDNGQYDMDMFCLESQKSPNLPFCMPKKCEPDRMCQTGSSCKFSSFNPETKPLSSRLNACNLPLCNYSRLSRPAAIGFGWAYPRSNLSNISLLNPRPFRCKLSAETALIDRYLNACNSAFPSTSSTTAMKYELEANNSNYRPSTATGNRFTRSWKRSGGSLDRYMNIPLGRSVRDNFLQGRRAPSAWPLDTYTEWKKDSKEHGSNSYTLDIPIRESSESSHMIQSSAIKNDSIGSQANAQKLNAITMATSTGKEDNSRDVPASMTIASNPSDKDATMAATSHCNGGSTSYNTQKPGIQRSNTFIKGPDTKSGSCHIMEDCLKQEEQRLLRIGNIIG